MNGGGPAKASAWLKTPYANLICHQSSGKHFARLRVKGKLIVRSLKPTATSVAKLRLLDLEKTERQKAESQAAVASGTITFGDALTVYRKRLQANAALKLRTKEHREERVAALLKS